MCWRKAWERRLQIRKRDDGSGENRLVERKVEWIGGLRGEFGIAVTARDIAERKLRQCRIGVDGRLSLFLGGLGLLALGFDEGFVFRGQDSRAAQIFVSVNVLFLLRLLFASALLACGFGYILGVLGTALRSAEK